MQTDKNTQMELKGEQEQLTMEHGAAPITLNENEAKETAPSKEEKDGDEMKKPSIDHDVEIMPPPPPVVVPLETVTPAIASVDSRPPSSLAGSEKDDDEGLSLQVLSARSSTPYTVQGVCCANANCDLEATDSSTVSPVKEEQTQLLNSEEKAIVIDDQNDAADKHNQLNGHVDERKKYTRSDLLDIRDEMTIVKPECLESARLQRLQFRKFDNASTNGSGVNRNKSYRSSNPPNDLMPAFFKRKAAVGNANGNNSNSNSFMYDNFKYNDSNPFNYHGDSGSSSNNNNYRRIGSGRISNREANWDYIPEEDPNKNNLPEFFNTKDTRSIPPKAQRHQKKYELDDNSNYIKRGGINSTAGGESSFRLGGSRHSINSSGEERYNSNTSSSTNNNNKSDEPEWFSCGPTSRLDIIELCGFNESDQQKIRQEMSKNKTDSNNNREEFLGGHGGHKEKKHLGFQFDDFSSASSHNNKGNNSSSGSKVPSSKFMPLFNAKKRDEELLSTNHNSTQSLNDFFKRNDMPSTATKEKLSLTEIPSVDEIEAKWRNPQQHNDSRNKTSSENFNNSSENFKKMLHQLNQQQLGSGSMSSPPPQHQQQPTNNNNQQTPLNLFNTDNLSNFIKHRNLQQQLMQKQQQQAAFAQLQLNAILSRPDTQMLLLSLARGEISKHGLVIQLANPNLSQAEREAISAVLTFSAAGQYHQQLAINSNQQQQQQFIANQLQNLALMQQINNKSPVGKRNGGGGGGGGGGGYQANGGASGGSSPRTYTQEELQSHANYILHNAMLKKKLEEQNIGLQKMLHLQTSMMNNSRGANDSLAGTKNFHHQQQQLQHQQQQNNQNHHQQPQQRHRRSSNGNRGNPMGRRRSTSSSSSNATINLRNVGTHIPLNADLQFRRQFEQRRNTIATATVGGDDFVKIPQRI